MWETMYGMCLAFPVVAYCFVPVYFTLGITSVYQASISSTEILRIYLSPHKLHAARLFLPYSFLSAHQNR